MSHLNYIRFKRKHPTGWRGVRIGTQNYRFFIEPDDSYIDVQTRWQIALILGRFHFVIWWIR